MYDSLTTAEEHILQMTKANLQKKRQSSEEEKQEAFQFMAHQGEVSASYHEKIFHSALTAAGVDPSALAKRHEKERNSVVNFLAKRKHRAMKLAVELKKQHLQDIAERTKRIHSLENLPRPQPGIVALLRSATDIQLNGQRGDVSIAPEQNLVHTKVERLGWVSALKWDLRGDMAIADWHFLWTPPRTGLLNVLSALSMNGWGFAYPGPGCIKGSSSWSIDAGIVITQLRLNGEPLTDSVQMRVDEQSFDSSDFPSSGGVILTANTLDSITALSYQNQYVALAQVPMIITVSAILYVLVAHGEAELNFMDGDFQLNVPFVYLFLD